MRQKYEKMEGEFRSKLTEVAVLRREIDKQKRALQKAKNTKEEAEATLKENKDKLFDLERQMQKVFQLLFDFLLGLFLRNGLLVGWK